MLARTGSSKFWTSLLSFRCVTYPKSFGKILLILAQILTQLAVEIQRDRMPETSASHKVNGHIAVSSAFLLLALAGWGGFAYSARTAAEQRVTLATQMQRIRTEQDEMRAERDRLRADYRDSTARLAEVEHMRSKVATLEADGRAASEERDQARAELASARKEIATLQERLEQAEAEPPSATGGTRSGRRGSGGQ